MMQQLNFLVIDDHQDVLDKLEEVIKLEFKNVNVNCALDEKLAAQFLNEGDIDLIISDYDLGGGVTTIELIRGVNHDIPVVFLTAYLTEDILELMNMERNIFYILKPYESKSFLTLIHRLIIKKSQRKLDQNMNINSRFMVDFLQGLSHEIINPLGIIYGYSKIVSKDEEFKECTDKIGEKIAEIKGKLTFASTLFSLPENFEKKEQIIFDDFFKEILVNEFSKVKMIVNDHNICGEQLELPVNILKPVFLELFQNTLDFTRDKTNFFVELNIKSEPGFLLIEMNDSGDKIEEGSSIFNPYWSTKKDIVYNVGLGLSRVKYFLSSIGGELHLSDKDDYKFIIILKKA